MPSILICDDDHTARFLLKRIFVRELDATIAEASNGRQALDLLGATHFDVLLLDLRMPVMDGAETLEALRKKPSLRKLPVIVLSGETNAMVVRRVVFAGVTDFLLKPLTRQGTQERLMAIVQRIRNGGLLKAVAEPPTAPTPLARLTDRVPDLRATVIGATEQVFGMMVKMDVEQVGDHQPPFAGTVLAGTIALTVGDAFDLDLAISCTEDSANVFAGAMFGEPAGEDALTELANIVAGRVKQAMVTQELDVTLGLPAIVRPDATANRQAPELSTRFGVIGTANQMDVSLRVRDRAPTAIGAGR